MPSANRRRQYLFQTRKLQGLVKELVRIEAQFCKQLSRHDQKIDSHEQAITGIMNALREIRNPPRVRAIGFTADFSKKG